jgi:hypothetical protein
MHLPELIRILRPRTVRGHGTVDAGIAVVQYRPENNLNPAILNVILNNLWLSAYNVGTAGRSQEI